MFNKLFNDEHFDCVSGLSEEAKILYSLKKFENNSIIYVRNSLYEANTIYQMFTNYTNDVLLFPMDDFLTSEALAISPELKVNRLETLKNCHGKKIIVTNLMGLLRYLPKKELFEKSKITLKINDDYDIDKLTNDLFKYGYTKEVTVNKTGEIAIRGFVVDIFPINAVNPIRIEFWGDTIESIREFNIDTQLTLKKIDDITIYPNSEFLIEDDIDTWGKKQKELPQYTVVSNITEYLDNPLIIYDDFKQIEVSYQLLEEEMLNYNLSINLPSDTKYMHSLSDIKGNTLYFLKFNEVIDSSYKTIEYNFKEIDSFQGNITDINNRLNAYLKDKTVIICLSDRYKANKLIEDLNNDNIIFTDEFNIVDGKINVIIKKITEGFIYEDIVLISEQEIFNKKNDSKVYNSTFRLGTKIRDITKLNIGDFVVHKDHGIGIYRGIKTLEKNGLKKDYINVEYKDNDKLYIPVEKIELITKFSSGDGLTPKLNKLGSVEWQRAKIRARKRACDIAAELLNLYAIREANQGFAFLKDNDMQMQFEKEFIYNETADQLRVLEEIKKDMESSHPMDRLLCGDVGYGKTEVAFRAMFKAILSGKQVAFLCPTTILSSQHYKNALERFKSFPVNIALLNRFVPLKEEKRILSDIKEGRVDLLIGTHRILSNDIEFKDLGLLVVDEEQRFGVKHKEKIKQYKTNIDILTLSATPIPRTLQMSMSGIRGLSLIETPPVNRYPIQTYTLEYNNQVIKDAIYKELSRNGQVFMLYNNIENIEKKAMEISNLVKEARVVFAHGRMDKDKLENVMMKFIEKEYDVLICTTIIETGIDIPNVNTLIINDADHFGLSQLYQIRGRVGRSNKIAYCYLMYDKSKVLSEVAVKRLKAIKEFTELGSGFAIAMRDLSIRGAGDILGSEQAGFVDTIGIELFLEMLNSEINKLKGIEPEKEISYEPLLNVTTAIDDKYVLDEELKIEIHKKISNIDSYEKLNSVKIELEDRFGKVSDDMIIYMHEEWFEKMANKLGINKIKQTKNFIEILLNKELSNKIDGQLLLFEVSNISKMFRFKTDEENLIITLDIVKLDKHFIYYLIDLMKVIEKLLKNKI